MARAFSRCSWLVSRGDGMLLAVALHCDPTAWRSEGLTPNSLSAAWALGPCPEEAGGGHRRPHGRGEVGHGGGVGQALPKPRPEGGCSRWRFGSPGAAHRCRLGAGLQRPRRVFGAVLLSKAWTSGPTRPPGQSGSNGPFSSSTG